jgi:hypothetical protein
MRKIDISSAAKLDLFAYYDSARYKKTLSDREIVVIPSPARCFILGILPINKTTQISVTRHVINTWIIKQFSVETDLLSLLAFGWFKTSIPGE